MNRLPRKSIGLFRAVILLLQTSRKRSAGRMKRQRQLMQNKKGSSSNNTLSTLGTTIYTLFQVVIHIFFAFLIFILAKSAQTYQAEQDGKIVVTQRFIEELKNRNIKTTDNTNEEEETTYKTALNRAAYRRTTWFGGTKEDHTSFLEKVAKEEPHSTFVPYGKVSKGIKQIGPAGSAQAAGASILFLWWFLMLALQGEGVDLDLQRRRNPIWEWLFSHPIPHGAVFLAEMLAPIAANPAYFTAPLFVGFLFGLAYNALTGLFALVLIGIPITLAAACLGKAIEIRIMLRVKPRSRGALIGILNWIGQASMFLIIFMMSTLVDQKHVISQLLHKLSTLSPWPLAGWVVGARLNAQNSFVYAIVFCLSASVLIISISLYMSIKSMKNGLTGNFGAEKIKASKKPQKSYLENQPLYKKELTWLLRDRSAIVQAILIPLSIAAVQLFNLRNLMASTSNSWYGLCGAAAIFGTYFLWTIGPRSLISEGAALWIPLTWPKGLEELLKAKANLWFLISTALILPIFIYPMIRYPASAWKVALVAIGWFAFGKSMALKSVTLVTKMSESGQAEKIPSGRRFAATLGMFTFSIGIITQQWHLAIIGIVYSWITAAALWQNFATRLPYLFDEWSEKPPPPPTLMHAMIAISILVEVNALIVGISAASGLIGDIHVIQAFSYTIIATLISFFSVGKQEDQGLMFAKICSWEASIPNGLRHPDFWCGDERRNKPYFKAVLAGIALGIILAVFVQAYELVLFQFDHVRGLMIERDNMMAANPTIKWSLFVMAVGVAPFAEEYLFRGLLFRALDKEWGGWKAIIGSAAFFAIYHPPISWLPVGLLGITCAIIFKKTGRLAPAVFLHMAYNAMVIITV